MVLLVPSCISQVRLLSDVPDSALGRIGQVSVELFKAHNHV